MKTIIKYMMLIVMIIIIAMSTTSCRKDKDKEHPIQSAREKLVGRWLLNYDDPLEGFTMIMEFEEDGFMRFTYVSKNKELITGTGTWKFDSFISGDLGMPRFSVILSKTYNEYDIDCVNHVWLSITNGEVDYLSCPTGTFSRYYGDMPMDDNHDPDDNPNAEISSNDMIAIWQDGKAVYDLKSGGKCDIYALYEGSYKYTDMQSGTWSYESQKRNLLIKSNFFANSTNSREWTVTSINDSYLNTTESRFTRQQLLPEKYSTQQGNDNEIVRTLYGKWHTKNGKEDFYLVFAENGQGYYQENKSYDGIYRQWFEWKVENGKIYRKTKSTYVETDISVMSENCISYKGKEYARYNNNAQLDIKYGSEPYPNYIKRYGVSYSLEYVKKSCKHGSGGERNVKQLLFFGQDNIWYEINYFTPSYEGIDNYWPDGTYIVNLTTTVTTTNWQYIGISSNPLYSDEDVKGKLTISHTNKYYKYDYKSDAFIIHFEGMEQ